MKKFLLSLFFPVFLFSCISDPIDPIGPVTGLRPIYVDAQSAKVISVSAPQPIVRLGKIYYKDEMIFVNESNTGVHVIDNADPANPVKIKFITIPGCHDIAIKDDIMYADNVGDLVAIDISDLDNPEVVKRLPNVQSLGNADFPELYEGWFECVDEDRGVVIGWEEAMLEDPKCWR